jgi:hypothetical protein
MAALLPLPEIQACDAIGRPYAAGTLETYVPATSTPKPTWSDPAAGDGHLNTNPVVLDSAGRAILYGDGLYRLVLRDAAGNLVYDQPSSTLVSAAMAPVIIAPTIAEAVRLLGIQDMIDAAVLVEHDRAMAAEAALSAATAAEAAARAAADTALGARIDAETAARIAGDAALQAEINAINATLGGLPSGGTTRGGSVTADALSFYSIAFAAPFSAVCFGIWVQPPAPIDDKRTEIVVVYTTLTASGSTGQFQDAAGTPVAAATPLNYVAFGW